ncbi:MAG: glycosyltransferase [Candidatus Omnitrophica bacterium]|nr:glycosyltransferase [Candidatus Omnitrophota bacterium]
MEKQKIVLLCTNLNGTGGTAKHIVQTYHFMDREKFTPSIVFASLSESTLLEFFYKHGCSKEDLYSVPSLSRSPWGQYFSLRKLWKKIQPDIIHSYFLHSDILSCLTGLKDIPRKRISSVEGQFIWDHVNGVGGFKNFCYKVANGMIRGKFFCTITVSKSLKEEVVQGGGVARRIEVVPVGIPLVSDQLLQTRSKDQEPVIVCLSRLSKDKGVDLFLQVAAILVKQAPRVRFKIAGNGEEEKTLQELCSNLGLDSHVEFLGWVENTTDCLNDADIFVMPSRREGCPLALIEAMMHKKAVVGFDVAGVNEVIIHEVNGYLVPAFDVNAMAGSIAQLIADPTQREKLENNARAHALAYYTIDREKELLEGIYSE